MGELFCGESSSAEMAVVYLEYKVGGKAQRLLRNNSSNIILGIWILWEHGIFFSVCVSRAYNAVLPRSGFSLPKHPSSLQESFLFLYSFLLAFRGY